MSNSVNPLPPGTTTDRGAVPLHRPVTIADLHAVGLQILAAVRGVQAQLAEILGTDDAITAHGGAGVTGLRDVLDALPAYQAARQPRVSPELDRTGTDHLATPTRKDTPGGDPVGDTPQDPAWSPVSIVDPDGGAR